jgi:hypothetical protein
VATALLEAPTVGSTLPRLFTPPLASNCRGPEPDHTLKVTDPLFDVPQECVCGCGLNPQTSWGFSCIYFLETFWGWTLLPWQKFLYWHALEKRLDGTGFRFKTLVVLVGRQQGKTRWIKGLGLWRLFMNEYGLPGPHCPAARLAVIAAQNLDYAETMLAEVVDEVRDHRLFGRELINHRVVNGGHRAILTNRRIWRAATASTRGARSLSVDLAMMDELRTHTTWDAYNAIAPTTTARPYSQVVCTSNAGEKRSLVLRSLREAAHQRIVTKNTESTQVGMWEWSVPMDVDPRDPSYWHLSLPAMGHLNDFTLDTVMGYFESMQYKNMPGFQTEYLCQWVDALEPGIIPAEFWQQGMDGKSRRLEGADVYAALDVSYDRSRAYVAVCSKREDGYLHIEIVQAARGTDWVVPWLKERKAKFKGVAVQKTGAPASGLIPDLQSAGVPVVEWGPGAALSSGCGLFYDKIVQGEVYHRPSLVLDRAAASTLARRVGDAWIFDRRNSPVDASPLVACAAAVWLSDNCPEQHGPEVHAWPDEDVIKQWEQEAQEKWGDSYG